MVRAILLWPSQSSSWYSIRLGILQDYLLWDIKQSFFEISTHGMENKSCIRISLNWLIVENIIIRGKATYLHQFDLFTVLQKLLGYGRNILNYLAYNGRAAGLVLIKC